MRVSVGIGTHNGAQFIEEQLVSILEQTIRPDEIVLSDAYSTDGTVEIAAKILKDSGVAYQILKYEGSMPLLGNFQNALDHCTGDIIFSCDQDDVWMPDKIESFLPYFQDGCNFVYSNAIVVDSNRKLLEKDFWDCYGIKFSELTDEEFKQLVLMNSCIL